MEFSNSLSYGMARHGTKDAGVGVGRSWSWRLVFPLHFRTHITCAWGLFLWDLGGSALACRDISRLQESDRTKEDCAPCNTGATYIYTAHVYIGGCHISFLVLRHSSLAAVMEIQSLERILSTWWLSVSGCRHDVSRSGCSVRLALLSAEGEVAVIPRADIGCCQKVCLFLFPVGSIVTKSLAHPHAGHTRRALRSRMARTRKMRLLPRGQNNPR